MCGMGVEEIRNELSKIVREAELRQEDVVVIVEKRSSLGHYDYRLSSIWVKRFAKPYEDNGGVRIVHYICGAYQEINCVDLEEVLEQLDFDKVY